MQCPKCGFEQPDGLRECRRCGVIFAKSQHAEPEPERSEPPHELPPRPTYRPSFIPAAPVLACVVGGIATVMLILGGTWWAGAIVGLALVVSATLGDLTESTVKRDLGIKDLGSILPGHGGFMDRMDSMLLSAPVAWALLALLFPVAVGPVA